MLLEYMEFTDTNELIVKKTQSTEVNLGNCRQYANKNCKHCYGRGFVSLDLGKGYRFWEESRRKLTCWCVDKQLAKLAQLEKDHCV